MVYPPPGGTPLTRTRDRVRARSARNSLKREAAASQERFEAELDQRVGGLGARLKAPPPLERVAKRHGGGYRSGGAEDYDWFYKLSRAEQARLRKNWMTSDSSAPTPSEVEQRIPMREWLELTRGVDLSKALRTGRGGAADRYGGMRPGQLIAGEPYDPAELHHPEGRRRGAHWRQAKQAGKLGRPYPREPTCSPVRVRSAVSPPLINPN